jgi:hypothetical protein
MRREHEDGSSRLALLDRRHHIEPRPVGEAEVDESYVEGLRREGATSRIHGVGLDHTMSGRLQPLRQRPAGQGIVFDQEEVATHVERIQGARA